MSTSMRRSLAPVIVGALLCIMALVTAGTAHAQCTNVTVTNNVCPLRLCLYSPTGVAPVCWTIPLGVSVITFPAGFAPAGGVSAGGNQYPFSALGCTTCYRQISSAVACCAVVCFDKTACTISIDHCTTPFCQP